MQEKVYIAVIGLGYVGLPLALAFAGKYSVIGYDINENRVYELNDGVDTTLEVTEKDLKTKNVKFTSDLSELKEANIYIVTVPTPIDENHQPDLNPLISSSSAIAQVIDKGDIIIYESTVYPGATEEVCVPILEQGSSLTFNRDFFVGYSPERINPGDKERPIHKILKVTSGSTPEIADYIDKLYDSVIEAGTFKAASIKVAEAAKVIENTQRDVNIALINELAIIFSHLGIDTADVIDAAATKWNFIKLQPGLVGGHCIGVDPYYLLHKSVSVGYVPDMIRTAREINNGMSEYISSQLVKNMINREQRIKNARVLVMGLSFKENCPDIRNSKVFALIDNLSSYGMKVDACDYWVDPRIIQGNFCLINENTIENRSYDAVIIAVAHKKYRDNYKNIMKYLVDGGTLYDMKNIIEERGLGQVRL
ncbi:nucleotide sugar dehydrogenase [Alteromonas pelagimontana]|uniref:Nucleotide sugar dehydrogenase n=1 Tax=Alteromonas pelagimontana TaxID=1858656 RepID=A0A6M4MEV7_9ALTE|nr:nucleotide sugar dehydrogenase [Alteromonas pelagimontana]QJR81527.1 nucleotide sugar dehydrogenase [Alteromonas pelagimontana]